MATALAILALWILVGAAAFLYWQFKQPEAISLLDVACCVALGAMAGPLVAAVMALARIKVRDERKAIL